MYSTTNKATHAYDVAVWRVGMPKMALNFSEIETREDAEFLVSEGIRMEEIVKKKTKKRPIIGISSGDSDATTMMRFVREHPGYVRAKQEYFWKRDTEKKEEEEEVEKEDEVGPSTMIPVKS
ncbi:Polyribonucleotide nucleotidyltransferase [Hordeum vulgare]|nr:Polyribonucleotide nucleotidyltransferase [Hordeum vulgare]